MFRHFEYKLKAYVRLKIIDLDTFYYSCSAVRSLNKHYSSDYRWPKSEATVFIADVKTLKINNNNNNNNKHDNVYGAVIMADPLREFTRFI